jgi:type I restriction enzyme S subunit
MTLSAQVSISEFCDTGSGTTPSRQKMDLYYGGNIPWIKSGELREAEIFASEECVTEQALAETSLKLVPAGALLVAMYGATVGRVGLLGIDATTNQAICHVLPDPKLADKRYLFHALQYKAAELIAKGVGGAQPNISQGVIKNTKVFLPPIDEQKRIAGILDQADMLRRQRQRALDHLNQLGQAIFYEMFGDPTINPMGWPVGTIDDLTASTQYGTSEKSGDEGDFPILRMGNLSNTGKIDISNLKYTNLANRDIDKYTVKNGDILFNRTNSPDLVGKTAVFYGDTPFAFAGYLVRLRTNDKATPEYISAYLNCPHGKKTLRGMCKAIIGMANINAKELRTIPITLPPIQLQNEFQTKLGSLNKYQPTLLKSFEHLDVLFSSLQHRAFRGEL